MACFAGVQKSLSPAVLPLRGWFYGKQYEANESRLRQSINRAPRTYCATRFSVAQRAFGRCASRRRPCSSALDAESALRGERRCADLWRNRQESSSAWALRPDAAERGNVSHAHPAAGLSAFPRALLQAVRDGELFFRDMCASCDGLGELHSAGGFREAHCAGWVQAICRDCDALVFDALSVYCFVRCVPDGGDTNDLCAGARHVGDGTISRACELERRAVVYVCGGRRDTAAAGWCAGGNLLCPGAADWDAQRNWRATNSGSQTDPHGSSLYRVGAGAVCCVGGAELERVPRF